MGPKRKNRGGRAGAPTKRKRKNGSTRRSEDDANMNTSRVGTIEGPPNSDVDEPQVEDVVKVELGSALEPSLVVSSHQKVLGGFSNVVPDMDIGEVEVKVMCYPEELEVQIQDEGGQDQDSNPINESEMTSRDPKTGEGFHAIPSSSKSSQWKAKRTSTEYNGNIGVGATGVEEGNMGDSLNLSYWKSKAGELASLKLESDKGLAYWKLKAEELACQKLESDKKIWDLEADLTNWKRKAKELERNSVELEELTDPFELPGAQSDAANSRLSIVQSLSSGSSVVDLTENGCTELTSSKVIGPGLVAAYQSKEASISGSSHPLLDEKIMDHVFQYIMRQPAKKDVLVDIKNFRQVCKPWRNAATRIYRKTAPVLKFGTYLERFALYTFGKLRKFLETMKDSEMIPFQSYEIKGNMNTWENQKLLEDFLRICGPDMISVSFRFKKSGTFQENFDLNASPELELPKLKTLIVHFDNDRIVCNTSEAHVPVNFIAFVLNASQSLREFRLKFKFSKYIRIPEYNLKPLWKFEETICRAIPKSVKVLDLQMVLSHRIFTCLAKNKNGLALEEFAVDPSYVTGASVAIRRFMKNQSPHLKVLRIVGSKWKNDNLILDFALLDKLETLKLADIYVNPFSIAEKFPNLITFDVVKWEATKTFLEFLDCAKKTVPSVKKIHLRLSFARKPLLKKISDCFPNITELRLHQGEHCIFGYFEEVFTHLCNLEVLHITVTPSESVIDLDAVLSGTFEEDCTRIRRARKFDHVSLADFQDGPSMLNLTRLRKLVLEKGQKKSHRKPVMLTDFSIHFVFLELAALEELIITGFSTKSMVRQVYLERLKAKLHLTWESE